MARTNVATERQKIKTHEEATAQRLSPLSELRRSTMCTMLWENTFYEGGASIADRIADLCTKVSPEDISSIAIQARNDMKLRHAPLFLAAQLSKHKNVGPIVTETLQAIIQRPDELAEFLNIYWQHGARSGTPGRHPLSRGVKVGLARAFLKFSEYQISKWNRDNAIKLRDVMFLVHPKPSITESGDFEAAIERGNYKRGDVERHSEGKGAIWKKLAEGTLAAADTWEVSLSAGKDKKETFERLLSENTLGDIALLMNLRNMIAADVDEGLIRARLERGCPRALPFRFVTAARYAPRLEDSLEAAMLKATEELAKLPGKTGLLIDVSGSMDGVLSNKGETTRIDAACGLAILLRERAESVRIASFSNHVIEIPPRRGFALRDAINKSQDHGGTQLTSAVDTLAKHWGDVDRFIVITDEQAADESGSGRGFAPLNYIINVASYEHGVAFERYTRINGWSEAVFSFIQALESEKVDRSSD